MLCRITGGVGGDSELRQQRPHAGWVGYIFIYLHNAHGDVVERTDEQGTSLKRYSYDAFGNEQSKEPLDSSPFRYCGEYYDKEAAGYYLRARSYEPETGRFTGEDTHWNTGNMVYGDNPVQWHNIPDDRKDPLGLNAYTYLPDNNAVMQSGNRYAYCMNDPVQHVDRNGNIAFLVITALAGLLIGGIAGAAYSYAQHGSVRWQDVAVGAAVGGVLGLTGGAAAGIVFAGSVSSTTLAVGVGIQSLSVAISVGGLTAGGVFLTNNIQNATAGYTVLGSYPGYLELADKIKARVFSIPTETWNKLSNAQQWALNQEFLDSSISRGHEFIFSVNAYSAQAGKYLYSEVQYLLSNGYKIVDEGWRMIR